jgi:hypothetical protein
LAPFAGALGQDLHVVDSRLDGANDADTYPQYSREGDAAAFAEAYTRFLRAITEHPFFRWLDTDRIAAERADVVEDFYRHLQALLTQHPGAAAVWHVMSLRIRRLARS